MSIGPGSLLLHYRIAEKIGEGGMGVVWKARDTRLDRDVAVKILPEEVARQPDRLARFEREAKAVAALAHPNILAVHDFGHQDETAYMVTELLEGETLRDRLGDGAVPARKAAEVARQVARGLAVAHDKGFVHRDLKPENIFITREGRAKILDFGLASLADDPATQRDDTPTRTELTTPGAVVGTANYMSPEQVRGERLDHRSDIFSFGTVLYEMLTGRQPFQRETVAETMTAVLRSDPHEGSMKSGEAIPPALERVVRRCLEKRTEERFQSASDLAFAVENSIGTSTTEAPIVGDAAIPLNRRFWTVAVPALVALVALIAGVLLGRVTAPEPASEPLFSQLTFRQGRIGSARFLGDGGSIVYSADWGGDGLRLFTVQPGTPESRPLEIDDAEIVSVSSRGELALLLRSRFVVGWTPSGTLARIALGGGAPRELLDRIGSADWDPAGEDLAVVRIEGGLSRLEYPAGKVLYETDGWLGDLRFSRDGARIAFTDHPQLGDNRGYIAVSDLAGQVRRFGDVWSSIEGAAWSPNGKEIWFTAGAEGTARALMAVDLEGQIRPLSRGPVDLVLHDVGADGRVLASSRTLTRGIRGRSAASKEELPLGWLDWSFPDAISDDGAHLLFTEQGEGGGSGYSAILRPLDGGPPVRLGEGEGQAIAADGSRVLVRLLSEGHALMIYPTGAGKSERIDPHGLLVARANWCSDGKRLFLVASHEGQGFRGYVLDPDSGKFDEVIGESLNLRGTAFHRDLGLVAARVVEGPLRIYSITGGEPRTLAYVDEAAIPVGWSRDGRFLYVGEAGRIPTPILRVDLQRETSEKIWDLLPAESAGLVDIGPVLVSPDARAYAYSYRRDLATLFVAHGFPQ